MRASSQFGRYIWVFLIGIAALSVLALAWPRLQANFRYLPVEIAIQRYYASSEISSERLPVLIRFSEEALQINPHYRYHDGLSVLHLLRAIDINTPPAELRSSYEMAMAEAENSLQKAPAQPAIWLRLARVRWILREEPEDTVAAWKMSIFTGRTTVSLLAGRVEVGLAHRGHLDQEGLSMLRNQLLLAWRLKPGALIQVLAQRDPQLIVTGGLVEGSDPSALVEMKEWLDKLR